MIKFFRTVIILFGYRFLFMFFHKLKEFHKFRQKTFKQMFIYFNRLQLPYSK